MSGQPVDSASRLGQETRAREEAAQDDLDAMLTVEEMLSYDERLQRVSGRMKDLERRSREALKAAEERMKQSQERLENIQDRASMTADGRRIYRSADGKRAFYEDGTEATSAEMASVQWKNG